MAKLRIVSRNNEDFYYVEHSESERIEKILKVLPLLSKWTLLDAVAKKIGEKVPSTIFSVRLLLDAERVEIMYPDRIETLAEFPFIRARKKSHNSKAHLTKLRFLRAPIYIKRP